jgi:hypothetical protein
MIKNKFLELNHWYIKDHDMVISLIRFCIKITICFNENYLFYRLTVYENGKEELVFNFYSLNEAVYFTEDYINKCNSKEEILHEYEELYKQKKLSKPIKKSN